MQISSWGAADAGTTTNNQSIKISSTEGLSNSRAKKRGGGKKDEQASGSATLSISGAASADRSKEITKRFQAMKETLQKQIGALNERLQKASEQGDAKLEKQLTESIKELTDDYSALDGQLSAALFAEQQRIAEEAKKKEEETSDKRKDELEKHKPAEERIKKEERAELEFLTKSDNAKESLHNSRRQKAILERTKGRLEGEMAADSAVAADRVQRHNARISQLNNLYEHNRNYSSIPYVSDKTILTEKKRIESGMFTPDEKAGIVELSKLSAGIERLEGGIGGTISELNESLGERREEAKEAAGLKESAQKEKEGQETSGAEGIEREETIDE